ncbi:MAG: TlpA family protein disulfide reductase [Flavicella sp.]
MNPIRFRILIVCFFSFSKLFAQYSISGTFTDAATDLSWAILYRLESGKEIFVANTKIKENHFEFELPSTENSGMYRVTYRLNGPSHVDFIFDREEVSFHFDSSYPEQTIVFETSESNQLFLEYLEKISKYQTYIDSIQVSHFRSAKPEHTALYKNGLDSLLNVQKTFEDRSKDQILYHFIKATQRFNASALELTPTDYYAHIKKQFFSHINFKDSVLVASNFLYDRVDDYVFYLHRSNKEDRQQILYKEAISKVLSESMTEGFKKTLLDYLVENFVANENFELVTFLLDTFYTQLPKGLKDDDYIASTKAKITLAIGAIAPDFQWEEYGLQHSLSALDTHKFYVVVFWSSGCSHCKKQLPKMYQFMKTHPKVKVVAVALEKKSKEWEKVKENFFGWHHILGLKKWKNPIAKSYDVSNTPTYFVLDSDKKILAKPADFRALEKTVNSMR